MVVLWFSCTHVHLLFVIIWQMAVGWGQHSAQRHLVCACKGFASKSEKYAMSLFPFNRLTHQLNWSRAPSYRWECLSGNLFMSCIMFIYFFVSPFWLRCMWVKVKYIALCGVLTQFFSCLFRLHKEAEGCAGGVSWRRSPFQIQSRAGVSAAQFPAPLFFLRFDLFLSLSAWYSDSFLHTLTKTNQPHYSGAC